MVTYKYTYYDKHTYFISTLDLNMLENIPITCSRKGTLSKKNLNISYTFLAEAIVVAPKRLATAVHDITMHYAVTLEVSKPRGLMHISTVW